MTEHSASAGQPGEYASMPVTWSGALLREFLPGIAVALLFVYLEGWILGLYIFFMFVTLSVRQLWKQHRHRDDRIRIDAVGIESSTWPFGRLPWSEINASVANLNSSQVYIQPRQPERVGLKRNLWSYLNRPLGSLRNGPCLKLFLRHFPERHEIARRIEFLAATSEMKRQDLSTDLPNPAI